MTRDPRTSSPEPAIKLPSGRTRGVAALREEVRLGKVVLSVLLVALLLSLTIPAIRQRMVVSAVEAPARRASLPDSGNLEIHIAKPPPGGVHYHPQWPGRNPFSYPGPVGAAATPFSTLINTAAQRHDLDPGFVAAVIQVESGYDPGARSPKGALGLMQLMPSTARLYGVARKDLVDPAVNIDAGARHLRKLAAVYRNDPELVLAAYNAGEKAVETYRGIPPYPETQDYVVRVRRAARSIASRTTAQIAAGSGD